MKIKCRIDEIELESDGGHPMDSVSATCGKCNHSTESFGTTDKSVRRCLLMPRHECPRRNANFYVAINRTVR